ncbi:MAG: MgtC/SapB family protein [Acidimicrobiales bacterium]|nr:MgtC/SapB family protein [Acidimicrobiales bacterium]
MTTASALLAAAGDTSFAWDDDVGVRLLVAAALGGVVGLEREVTDQAAGLRTHIAVALGASLFGVISTLGFLEFDQLRANSTLQADVTRVASNVVVGIGFLGAGLIFRQGSNVRNLTTAASLWTVAAIGLAAGVGDVTTAAVATAVLVGSLVLLRPVRALVRHRLAGRSSTIEVRLRAAVDPAPVIATLDTGGGVETSKLAVREQDGGLVLTATVAGRPGDRREWMARLASAPEVASVGEV